MVAWDREPVTCTLADALGASTAAAERQEETEADRFLRDLLADGHVLVSEVEVAREKADIAKRRVVLATAVTRPAVSKRPWDASRGSL